MRACRRPFIGPPWCQKTVVSLTTGGVYYGIIISVFGKCFYRLYHLRGCFFSAARLLIWGRSCLSLAGIFPGCLFLWFLEFFSPSRLNISENICLYFFLYTLLLLFCKILAVRNFMRIGKFGMIYLFFIQKIQILFIHAYWELHYNWVLSFKKIHAKCNYLKLIWNLMMNKN